MKNISFIFLATYIFQTCYSVAVQDAEDQLKGLKHLSSKKLEEAFSEHAKLLDEINSAADAAKNHGRIEIQERSDHLRAKFNHDRHISHQCRRSREDMIKNLQKSSIDDLKRCVDHQTKESVNSLSTQKLALSEEVWNALYEEERHVIHCGLGRHCLDGAVADVKDKLAEVVKAIDAEIEISRQYKDAQVHLIKTCAKRAIGSAAHALNNVPTCNY